MIFAGIHISYDGIYVEVGDYEDYDEAYEDMERNDSDLIVLTREELSKICKLVNENDYLKLTKI